MQKLLLKVTAMLSDANGWQYLYFPCGIIRGALSGLGIDAVVTAESTELPTATFQIKTKGAKP